MTLFELLQQLMYDLGLPPLPPDRADWRRFALSVDGITLLLTQPGASHSIEIAACIRSAAGNRLALEDLLDEALHDRQALGIVVSAEPDGAVSVRSMVDLTALSLGAFKHRLEIFVDCVERWQAGTVLAAAGA